MPDLKTPQAIEQFKNFYDQWSSLVFTVCYLFLGDQEHAERATERAFLNFFHAEAQSALPQKEIVLLQYAVASAKEACSAYAQPLVRTDKLQNVLRLIPCEQRAVFVLHGVLRVDVTATALATGLTNKQALVLWLQALTRIRELWLNKR